MEMLTERPLTCLACLERTLLFISVDTRLYSVVSLLGFGFLDFYEFSDVKYHMSCGLVDNSSQLSARHEEVCVF